MRNENGCKIEKSNFGRSRKNNKKPHIVFKILCGVFCLLLINFALFAMNLKSKNNTNILLSNVDSPYKSEGMIKTSETNGPGNAVVPKLDNMESTKKVEEIIIKDKKVDSNTNESTNSLANNTETVNAENDGSIANNTTNASNEKIYEHDGKYYVKGKSKGSFYLTGFCACDKCGSGTGYTASGKKVRENHTVAADWNVLPKNTMIILENAVGKDGTVYDGVYQVEDRGGAVKNKHIDIYRPTHELAALVTHYGKAYGDVYIAVPIDIATNSNITDISKGVSKN